MGEEHLLARAVLTEAFAVFDDNVRKLTLEEFLDAEGGYRSILGLTKHTVGWTHVYHSYAFEEPPRPWQDIGWPRGLIDTIDPNDGHVRDARMARCGTRRVAALGRRSRGPCARATAALGPDRAAARDRRDGRRAHHISRRRDQRDPGHPPRRGVRDRRGGRGEPHRDRRPPCSAGMGRPRG